MELATAPLHYASSGCRVQGRCSVRVRTPLQYHDKKPGGLITRIREAAARVKPDVSVTFPLSGFTIAPVSLERPPAWSGYRWTLIGSHEGGRRDTGLERAQSRAIRELNHPRAVERQDQGQKWLTLLRELHNQGCQHVAAIAAHPSSYPAKLGRHVPPGAHRDLRCTSFKERT